MALLTLKTFPDTQAKKAYNESQKFLESGGRSPFPDVFCSASKFNEPIHIYRQGKMVGFASIQWFVPEGGDLWKFYMHPDCRLKGVGRQAAKLVIDHFFAKPGIEQITLEISGDTWAFWASVARLYPGRAFCGLTHAYFVGPGLKILEIHPWIAEYLD